MLGAFDLQLIEHEGVVIIVRSRQTPRTCHHLQWINTRTSKRPCGRQRCDGNPRSDANHDTQSNASSEQGDLAHMNSSLHSVTISPGENAVV